MADSESNGKGRNRRELALDEIEALAINALHDLYMLTTSVQCMLAEAREARRADR